MSEPRFYCPNLKPGTVTLSATESRHALTSLRLRPGNAVTLFDGRGHIAHAVLQPERTGDDDASQKRSRSKHAGATVSIEHVQTLPPPQRTLTLIVPGCKGPRLIWMIEKLTELGVTRIVLADFERSVVHPGETHTDKLRRTAIEACKQCGRAWLPEIESGIPLRDALASAVDDELLLADPDKQAPLLSPWLSQHAECRNLVAAIGPEGGLTPTELDMLKHAGGQPVRLADHTLRIETAAVALAANWAAVC